MVTLSNGRTSFSFNANINNLSFDGSCSLVNDHIIDMNASVRLAEPEEEHDPYVGNINYNKGAESEAKANISVSAKDEYMSDVLGAVLTLVTEIEQSN
jgi:hypothetical protein